MNILPELDQVMALAATGQYKVLPVSCEILSDFTTPIETMKVLKHVSKHCYMDTCIAIRIAYKKNGRVFVRSGAGIVADSVPEQEYEECLNKARSSLKALELAQEEAL